VGVVGDSFDDKLIRFICVADLAAADFFGRSAVFFLAAIAGPPTFMVDQAFNRLFTVSRIRRCCLK
jgi:hypothetical protein